MWIVIEDIVLGMISCQISYRLKENGIEILYKGKVRRAYKWDEMRTHRIVYMGKGTLRNSEDFWCDVKACVVFSTRRIKDSFFQSPFPFAAWNEQISGVCLLFPGAAMDTLFLLPNQQIIYFEFIFLVVNEFPTRIRGIGNKIIKT